MKSSAVNAFLILMVFVGLAANVATASRIRGSSSSSSSDGEEESISTSSRSQTSETTNTRSNSNRKVRQLLRENPKSNLKKKKEAISSSPSPIPTKGAEYYDPSEVRNADFEKSSSPSPLPTKGIDYDPSRATEKNKKFHKNLKNAVDSSVQQKLEAELPTTRGVGPRAPFEPDRKENEEDENRPNLKKMSGSGLLSRPLKLTTKAVGAAIQKAQEKAKEVAVPPNQKIGSWPTTGFGAKAVPKKAVPSKRRWR